MLTQVSVTQDPHNPQSAIEVVAPDRPGLLALIGSVFSSLDISISSARITTLGERVEDIFYVTDSSGQPLTDPDTIGEIEISIRDELDQHLEKMAS